MPKVLENKLTFEGNSGQAFTETRFSEIHIFPPASEVSSKVTNLNEGKTQTTTYMVL